MTDPAETSGSDHVASKPRTLVILGHPRGRSSLCGALAEAYFQGARQAGCPAVFADLSALNYEVSVTAQIASEQPLEPDLRQLRDDISAADHIAFVYPTWWGTHPAIMKGALDRLMMPGYAFCEQTGGTGFRGLLTGRTAEIITTMDTPGPVYDLLYRAPGHNALARATLGHCGVETVRITRFGPVKGSTPTERSRWLNTAAGLGESLRHGSAPLGHRIRRQAKTWAAALRLQFYPMTFLAYSAGSLWAARDGAGGIHGPSFWLGYLALFLIEAATVFANDVFDYESDRRNAFFGPFSGGSRVLVDGKLNRGALLTAAAIAIGCAAGLVAWIAHVSPGSAPAIIATMMGMIVLGLGYTIPPLKLSHRTLGEVDVALTHSIGVILVGVAVQGGALTAAWPYAAALPLCLAVLPSITLSGIPDMDADRAAGKRTLAVRFGARGAIGIAIFSTASAVLAAFLMRWNSAAGSTLQWLPVPAALHGGWLILRLARLRPTITRAQRIDGTMVLSLSFILWFATLPVLNLLVIE